MKYLFQKPVRIFLITILYVMQACATPASNSVPSNSVPILNSKQNNPISKTLTMTSISFIEEGQSPTYNISAQIPKLAGSNDERVLEFNQLMEEVVKSEIDYFRENVLAQMSSSPVSAGSFFDAKYTLLLQVDEIWSIKFGFTGYTDGGAHPYQYSGTVNYDLKSGKWVSLSDLFLDNSNYLEVLSKLCIAELSKRDIGFFGGFQDGAAPLAKNYSKWNITADGLMITFDEYQVAPYAAGEQTVFVSIEALKEIIAPDGFLNNLSEK